MWMRQGTVHFASVLAPDAGGGYSLDQLELPAGWTRTRDADGPWTRLTSPTAIATDSGWKLHIASTAERADAVLTLVAEHLLSRGVSFKHLRSPEVFRVMSAKYAPRTSAGKFIAVYPSSNAEFDDVVEELADVLNGDPGPTILTDLPLGSAPLHARYGAFRARRATQPEGLDAFLMSVPGADVVDGRELHFSVPSGVALPKAVAAALDERNRTRSSRRLPYTVTAAMHFSNGGGVYDAHAEGGRRVALKEGRKHTGLGLDGTDAESRLKRERRALDALAGIRGVPAVLDWHAFEDRSFLVEPFIEGARAIEFVAQHHPGTKRGSGVRDRGIYAERVTRILRRVEQTLTGMHELGWVFGDLHPGNLLIGPDDEVTLIDFETARRVDEAPVDFTFPPGFSTPDLDGIAGDRRRIELLRLWFFAPENAYWDFSDAILQRTARRVEQSFGIAPFALNQTQQSGAARRYVEEILPIDASASASLVIERVSARIVADAVASAAGGRPMFVGPGAVSWTFGSGAAGTLFSVADRLCEHPEVARALADAAEGTRRMLPGLFSGMAGAAIALDRLGDLGAAHRAIERAAVLADDVINPDLEHGLFGLTIAALRLGRDELATALAGRARESMSAGTMGRAGMLKGPSGSSLAGVRIFELTQDEEWLALAEMWLASDLERLHWRDDGVVLLEHDNRKMLPSLAHGSLGVAYVASELARHRPNAQLERVFDAAGATCLAGDWADQGLFDGRAGALAYLAAVGPRSDEERGLLRANTAALLERFVEIDGALHFPGISGLRFSDDLAHGAAGALHALKLAAGAASGGPIPVLGRPLIAQPPPIRTDARKNKGGSLAPTRKEAKHG